MKTSYKQLTDFLLSKNVIWVTFFAIAMGMLESAVVIYLRELYYPDGFGFPLSPTSYTVAITELLREAATLIMLLAFAMLVGKSRQERFAWFIYSFAIWDIFYYIFLYLIIGWPMHIAEWDVLFLLPIMWVGPVWAPVLLSLWMILLALIIVHNSRKGREVGLDKWFWLSMITGSLVVIIAFCKDFYGYMTKLYPEISKAELFFSKHTFDYAANYEPQQFDSLLFIIGFAIIVMGTGYLRSKRS